MIRVITALMLATLLAVPAIAGEYVHGYYRSNGTYVHGYHRSSPDQYRYNNYSARGNVNPYTGKVGHQRDEYTNPPAYNKSYGSSSDGWGSSSQNRSRSRSNNTYNGLGY